MSAVIKQFESYELNPKLGSQGPQFLEFCKHIESKLIHAENRAEVFQLLRAEVKPSDENPETETLARLFASNVVLDLAAQGWNLRVANSRVRLRPPISDDNGHSTKDLVRQWHLLGRDAQLSEKPVTEFVRAMERRRLFRNKWHSIFSLMRDGRELSTQLEHLRDLEDDERRHKALRDVISPYVQFVETDSICEQTGLRLADIWRYFRHTWVNEYKSIPGRSIMILIRDAAVQNHPVIGIAALGSSVVQNRKRDQWIGWDQKTFVQSIVDHPTTKRAAWALHSLQHLIDGIYVKDLMSEGLCSQSDIRRPDNAVIRTLTKEAGNFTRMHRGNPQKQMHKGVKREVDSARYWRNASLTHLYRSKRCKQLAKLLTIRKTFQEHGLKSGVKKSLVDALSSQKVRTAIGSLARMVKAEHVGINMMDITVCGAIAPYNLLLGGKLVCMLLCSPEVSQYYSKRYKNQVSIIASSMKGAAVVRKPRLALMVTTSLYGVGSSQYNRVKIPLTALGGLGKEAITYEDLGHSYGFGTYHFRKETVRLGSLLISRMKGNRRVNSIFGEGVNPLMRKIREALDGVGLPSDKLMQHGNKRVTYGVRLAANFRQILLGIDNTPRYLIPQKNAAQQSERIADHWSRRWLSPRITRPDILERVAQHSLSYPIHHGGTVSLGADETDLQLSFLNERPAND